MNLTTLTAQELRKAADLQEQIQNLQNQLARILGGAASDEVGPAGAASSAEAGPKRKISAAGIARIRAAQKARWAKARRQGTIQAMKPKVSTAGRQRLSELAAARWARVKAAGKKHL